MLVSSGCLSETLVELLRIQRSGTSFSPPESKSLGKWPKQLALFFLGHTADSDIQPGLGNSALHGGSEQPSVRHRAKLCALLITFNWLQLGYACRSQTLRQVSTLKRISGDGPQPFWHQRPVSWKTIFPRTGAENGVGMVQVHYIYCALFKKCIYF